MSSVNREAICFKCENNDPSFKVKCSNRGLVCLAEFHEKCLILTPSCTASSPSLSSESSVLCTWYCNNCGHCNTLSVSFAFLMNNQLIQSLEKLNTSLVQGLEKISNDLDTGFSHLGNKLTQNIEKLGCDLSQELKHAREKLSVDVQQVSNDLSCELKSLNEGIVGLQSTLESHLAYQE